MHTQASGSVVAVTRDLATNALLCAVCAVGDLVLLWLVFGRGSDELVLLPAVGVVIAGVLHHLTWIERLMPRGSVPSPPAGAVLGDVPLVRDDRLVLVAINFLTIVICGWIGVDLGIEVGFIGGFAASYALAAARVRRWERREHALVVGYDGSTVWALREAV